MLVANRSKSSLIIILLVVAVGATAATVRSDVGTPVDKNGNESLEWAFKFASAIDPDPKDKAMAQESVVIDYAAAGDLARAAGLAGEIDGWRRGTAYADIAMQYARAGNLEKAGEFIRRAQLVRSSIKTWEGQRIDAKVAKAEALLGRTDQVKTTAGALTREDERQYAERGAATVAFGEASSGNFDEAMALLDSMGERKGLEATWWRYDTCLELSRHAGLTPEQRKRALTEALEAAGTVPGWKQGEALALVAVELEKAGLHDKALDAVTRAGVIARNMSATMPAKGEILVTVARAWEEMSKNAEAIKLLEMAENEAAVPNVIYHPATYARIASVYRLLGDETNATRLNEMAITVAEGLENARPRALAVVEICRSMGLSNVAPDQETVKRFDALYIGLDDPW